MTRTEWIERAAARLRASTNWGDTLIPQHAAHLADVEEERHGGSGLAWRSPEDAVDESEAEAVDDEE